MCLADTQTFSRSSRSHSAPRSREMSTTTGTWSCNTPSSGDFRTYKSPGGSKTGTSGTTGSWKSFPKRSSRRSKSLSALPRFSRTPRSRSKSRTKSGRRGSGFDSIDIEAGIFIEEDREETGPRVWCILGGVILFLVFCHFIFTVTQNMMEPDVPIAPRRPRKIPNLLLTHKKPGWRVKQEMAEAKKKAKQSATMSRLAGKTKK